MHGLIVLAETILIIAGVGGAVLAWRLSRGPIDLPWLTARIQESADRQVAPGRVVIGSAALAWEGFHQGLQSPLDIRLTDIWLFDAAGARELNIPRAGVTLSVGALLAGRIEPRSLYLQRPTVVVQRAADGTLSLRPADQPKRTDVAGPRLPTLDATVRELSQPPARDAGGGRIGALSQVRRLRVHDAAVKVVDVAEGITWEASGVELDLSRVLQGGVMGTASAMLHLGPQLVPVSASLDLPPNGNVAQLKAQIGPIVPAALAATVPKLPLLAAIAAPVSGEVVATFGPGVTPFETHVSMEAGPGTLHIGSDAVPISAAVLVASGTTTHVALRSLRLVVSGPGGGTSTTLEASGTLHRSDAGRIEAQLALGLDHVAFTDLPALWPTSISPDLRSWIIANVTSGIAHDGHFEVEGTSNPALTDVVLSRATGSLQGDGLTVHWLRPVPPVEQARVELRLLDPDTVVLDATSGRQAPEASGGDRLELQGLQMRVTGLRRYEQDATIRIQAAGRVPAALALLRDPRLGLLSRHPLPVSDPAGQMQANVMVSLPLLDRDTIDQVAIGAKAHLSGLHLGGVAAGRDLDDGVLDLSADNDGLAVDGSAVLAGIPAQIRASMDFRAGPPVQVVQRIDLAGRPDARELARAGLDAGEVLSGPVPLNATLIERRNGTGTLDVKADLTDATLQVAALGWRKPTRVAATGQAELRLERDRLIGIDPIRLDGSGLDVRGQADVAQGRITAVRASRIVLGRSVGQATVQFPAHGPIAVSLTGSMLDLAGRFGPSHRQAEQTQARPAGSSARGPGWSLDARFDRVGLTHGRMLGDVVVHAVDDGRVLRELRLNGVTGSRAPVRLVIQPEWTGGQERRSVIVSAADAGALLRDLDVVDTMDGGRLTLTGAFADAEPGRPLSGTAEIDDFRLRNAPVIGKLLEAVTLYGLVEALRGPGVGFNKLIAPFRLDNRVLRVDQARMFSASLGLTAEGTFDLGSDSIDLQGTIVPAYFFNSLLGRVPVLGRLFSPEQGGGVISGSYTVRGPIANPHVTVNPLTALTPGLLRRLFGIF